MYKGIIGNIQTVRRYCEIVMTHVGKDVKLVDIFIDVAKRPMRKGNNRHGK